MELLDSFHLPAFSENAEGSVSIRWKKWLKQFELHLTVKNIIDPDLKKAHLLYYGKDDIQKVLDQAGDQEDYVSDSYQRAIRQLNEYFLPKVSRIYERSVFRKMDRDLNEKIESFILRLKKQAEYCDFGEQTEFMLIDQIVEKLQETQVKKKILRGNYNLKEIQQMISTDELVKEQMKTYNNENQVVAESNLNAISGQKRQAEFECFSCGQKGHLSKDLNCPARDKTCGNCQQKGHFAKKCRKRIKFNNSQRSNGNRFINNNRRRGIKGNYYRNPVNNVMEHEEEDSENFGSEIICNLNGNTMVDCLVGGKALKFILDTGASANILAEKDYKENKEKFEILQKLKGSDRIFRAYGCKENL